MITDAISLRKKDFFPVYYEIDEDVFTQGDEKVYKAIEQTYQIVDVYNNYFIDKFGNKLKPSTLINATNFIKHYAKTTKLKRCSPRSEDGQRLRIDLMSYLEYKKQMLLAVPDEQKKQYINFKYTPNIDVRDTEIYQAFNEVWSRQDWCLIDIVDNTAIIDSMCKIIGYIFTPDRSWRYFAVLESTCSGWGKTGFINAICSKTQCFLHKINYTQEVDKFTYAAMYMGQDVVISDDPGDNIEKLANEINCLVANKEGTPRLMQEMGTPVTGCETRVVVTSNVPFKSKQTVQIDNKMIVVKTNQVENRNDAQQRIISNLIVKYIVTAPEETVHEFISGCVDLLQRDESWIRRHLGLHMNASELSTKMIDVLNLCESNGYFDLGNYDAQTLEDLVKDEYKKLPQNTKFPARLDKEEAGILRSSYISICNALKSLFFNDSCKYYGKCSFMTGSQDKNRARNFKLTEEIIKFIRDTANNGDKDTSIQNAEYQTSSPCNYLTPYDYPF